MRKNRIKLYWLLLMAVVMTGTVAWSVGDTQARYSNTATAVAVVAPVQNITSNCLITADDAPRTVLLGQMDAEETMTVPFWLLSSGDDREVRLNWGVSDAAYAEYLHIAVRVGSEQLTAGEEVELLENIRMDLELSLTLTEAFRTTSHEEMKVNVLVTLDEQMWGTFQVILPEVEQSGSGQPTAGTTVSDNAASAPGATDSASGSDAGVSEGDAAPGVSDNDAESDAAGTYGLRTVSENDAITEGIGLKTLPTFRAERQLPVQLTLAEYITSVCLGVQNVEEDTTVLEALPDYTMLSVEGGAGCYMVYGDYLPELVLDEMTSLPLLLDFRYARLAQDTALTIAMEAYAGSALQAICTAVTAMEADQNWQTVLLSRTAEEETAAGQATVMSGPVLNFTNRLELCFPLEWEAADLEYSVEYLTITENRITEYIPVELSEDGLQATYYEEEDDHRLVLRLGQKFARPGTYRINISWSYEGLCYDTMQTTFFVNCVGRGESIMSDLEVSNDD